MKRVLFLLLIFLVGFVPQRTKAVEGKRAAAVGVVAYVLEATSEKPGLVLPVFPQTVSVSVLESMVSNVEELQRRVEKVYKYNHLTLLKTWKKLFLLPKGQLASGKLSLNRPPIQIDLTVKFPTGAQLPVLLSVTQGEKELSRISYFANWGKTVIVGSPFPTEKTGSARALFIAATYWERDIHGRNDYPHIVDFYEKLNGFVPTGEEDFATRQAIARFFKEQYDLKKSGRTAKISSLRLSSTGGQTAQEPPRFAAYDVPPMPVGGFAAIQKNLSYPENARKNHIEGAVILHVLISKSGRVLKTKILKSVHAEMDSAAVRAIRKTKWTPAFRKKNGKKIPVQVWVSIPVVFRLKE